MRGSTRSVYGLSCDVNLPLMLCSLISSLSSLLFLFSFSLPSFSFHLFSLVFSLLFPIFLLFSSLLPLISPPLSLPPFLPPSSLTYRTLDLYSPCCYLALVHASPLQRDSLFLTDWK